MPGNHGTAEIVAAKPVDEYQDLTGFFFPGTTAYAFREARWDVGEMVGDLHVLVQAAHSSRNPILAGKIAEAADMLKALEAERAA